MLTSTLLVLMMVVPGLALFYGGMVRAKNVLSVLIQVITVFSLIAILWVAYGYSLAFSGDGKWIGNLDKLFLKGVTTETLAATFTKGVSLPEQVFVCFQLTFAGITGALIVGAFAERVKFAAVLLFALIWFTAGYLPIAHMVWATGGFLFERGALDFAGGTVVHINAGVAGLVGSYFVGKRIGFGQVALRPHNVTYTFVGAALLWVGWFGFNAGSNLEANAGAALAFLNTMLATAAAILAWALAEKLFKGKSSALGVASGAVAGLVGITPACGTVGPFGAIAIGAIAAFVCVWGVTGLKKLLKADDTLDVFGVHGIGGIVGAVLTGVFSAASLGGVKGDGYSIPHQVLIQIEGVAITVAWIGVVSVVGFAIAKLVFGLRVSEDAEREGLDITSHGEAAYEA
ncbi:ammonium transporter [Pseudoxanthomonas winnipegensis]|uniref:Ammonium transporter n=2 Tax=Pseudoxanthomonas winnipegensis TaxID=2480810 RepID=A0A4Q8LBR9_9GAMM|nr:ammonium transporter [Pseudoxanthomonas winnipegensis]RZZ83254.1 ammonium transporter [Pseudoxanthomonas winnipegensis]TAA26220.1 ammonium transporter [Pseudoxanthomonas winnipegensis]TAA40081.1 ammonium transporter [Pseudoxanthomonas winnipegensis]TBV72656.1 ammonium transporter [Pseudoxanthomonas winnipegensis]